MRGWVRIAVGVVVGVGLVGVGVGVGSVILEPSAAKLPVAPREVVTAAVTSGTLAQTYTGSGQVEASGATAITVTPPATGKGIVTATPIPVGSQVKMCHVLVEVSGRPLIALPGTVEAYRDLTVGDTGDDVKQLQAALKSCGYKTVADGKYGAATDAAVRKLYAAAGYSVPLVDDPTAQAAGGSGGQDANAAAGGQDGAGGGQDAAAGGQDGAAAGGSLTPAPTAIPQVSEVPMGEVAFLPSAGIVTQVQGVNSAVGSDATVTVSGAGLTYHVQMDPAQRVKVGDDPTMAIALPSGTVSLPTGAIPIAPVQGQGNGAGMYFDIQIPLPAGTDPSVVGQSYPYTITIGADTTYDKVVPVSALKGKADGSTVVTVVRGSEQVDVPVKVLASGAGSSAVEADGLQVGDKVVVGEK